MEDLVSRSAPAAVMADFWRGRRVLLTGHTGFKGRWLGAWLAAQGAEVTGFSIDDGAQNPDLPDPIPAGIKDVRGDVRDLEAVEGALALTEPEVVLHLAAQAIVSTGYRDPVGTYATNVMGCVNLLDAVRRCGAVRAVVVVTSDKCYENREWVWPYRENEALGGHDPYSNSKACAELVVDAYRKSYFATGGSDRAYVASARAGNVVGPGDWSQARLIPDLARGLMARAPAQIRRPDSIRPWQHVLEPVWGYLLLAQRLFDSGADFEGAWNFGPSQTSEQTVARVADRFCAAWGEPDYWEDVSPGYRGEHEAGVLKLDSRKAETLLGWKPRLDFGSTLDWTAAGYRDRRGGVPMQEIMARQIARFSGEPVHDGPGG